MGTPVRAATGALAWIGAVVLATGVGLTAVNVIGVGIIGPGPQVLSPTEVDARLAAAPSAPAAPATDPTAVAAPTSTPAAPQATAPEVLESPGGTVVARCVAGVVEIVTTNPAQGWGIHDEGEPARGRVRFESGNSRVELRLSCVDGHPVSNTRVDDH